MYTIAGYAAVWFDARDPGTRYRLPSGQDECFAPGAFAAALAAGGPIAFRLGHAAGLPDFATTADGTLRLGEDARGLWYAADLRDEPASGRLAALVRAGAFPGASVGWPAFGSEGWRPAADPAAPGARLKLIGRLPLDHVSLARSPCYRATSARVVGRAAAAAVPGRRGGSVIAS